MKRPPRPSFTSRTPMQIPDPLSHHQPALVPRSSRASPGASPGAHIQIGATLHSTGQGRPENGTPWLTGARAAKEVAESSTFQIRDSAISNPRIWIVSELPALSIKGPGKAAIQQSGFNVPSGIISLSLLSSYPSFPVHLYLRVRFHLIQEFQEPLNVSSFAQGPLTRSSPDPGVTSISLWSHAHS